MKFRAKTMASVHILSPFQEVLDKESNMTVLTKSKKQDLHMLLRKISVLLDGKDVVCALNSESIKEIIDSLKVLDTERLQLHQAVEEETIISSVLRHKVMMFPRNFQKEKQDAVLSAYLTNNETINQLKDQLKVIEESIIQMKPYLEQLKKENIFLGVKENKLKMCYDEILELLNKTLSVKASLQIKLNETYEDLQNIWEKTEEFKNACIELDDDRKAEFQEFTTKKQKLTSELNDTLKKIEDQNVLNYKKKNEVDDARDIQLSCEAEMKDKRNLIELLQENCEKLYADKLHQNIDYEKKVQEIESLTLARNSTLAAISKIKEEFQVSKDEFCNRLQSLDEQIKTAKSEQKKLLADKEKTLTLLENALSAGKKESIKAEEALKSLWSVKDDFSNQSIECAKLKRENGELQASVERILQDHIIATTLLNKEFQSLQQRLVLERKQRQILQTQHSTLSKEGEDYINEFTEYVKDAALLIDTGKDQCHKQSEEGILLCFEFKEAEKKIKEKKEELIYLKENYLKMYSHLTEKIRLKSLNTSMLLKELAEKKDEFDQAMPSYVEFQNKFSKVTIELDHLKNQLIEKKDLKKMLEVTVEKKKRVIPEMVAVQAVNIFESDISIMNTGLENMHNEKLIVKGLLAENKEKLKMQCDELKALYEKYQDKDVLMIEDLMALEKKTLNRGKSVSIICKKFGNRLTRFSDFIHNVTVCAE
ncbi:dynein regulatory complex subunit 2 isoform X4 [Hydra vulgaris]|uniref:Dynein regulatory complex subunit 2 isoform X4 n=1 Tax=Hydra vulgaris TaxID=6087 RepID=A0ABM4CIB2_HYDVU